MEEDPHCWTCGATGYVSKSGPKLSISKEELVVDNSGKAFNGLSGWKEMVTRNLRLKPLLPLPAGCLGEEAAVKVTIDTQDTAEADKEEAAAGKTAESAATISTTAATA